MTLIAAIPCTHGFVLAADSQETITNPDGSEYRNTVQKMLPQNMGCFQVIVAGSGNACLIESFIVRLKRRLDSTPSVATIAEFVNLTEDELVNFYSLDVKLYPHEDKTISMFLAAVGNGECGIWVQKNLTLLPAE